MPVTAGAVTIGDEDVARINALATEAQELAKSVERIAKEAEPFLKRVSEGADQLCDCPRGAEGPHLNREDIAACDDRSNAFRALTGATALDDALWRIGYATESHV